METTEQDARPRVMGRRPACKRCGATMIPEYATREGTASARVVWKCLSCGEEYTPQAKEQIVQSSEPRGELAATAPPPKKWQDLAVLELKGLIRQVQAAESNRVEAERLQKALMAYGVAELPSLPWVKPRPVAPHCEECGRPFENTNQYRRLPDGRAVCRGEHQPVAPVS